MKNYTHVNNWTKALRLYVVGILIICLSVPSIAFADKYVTQATGGGGVAQGQPSATSTSTFSTGPTVTTKYSCGGPGQSVSISIDIGCQHKGNPIEDATFAIIKFLSDGVGLVIVASLIWAGIQFTSSRGDSQETAKAIKRVRSNVMALFLFIFAYALLNYVVPGQILQ